MDASVSPKILPGQLEADVREIVGARNVHTATAADAVCGVQPKFVVEPGTEQELARVLKAANAAGVVVIPRGGGTKLEWGNPPSRAEMILSTARLDRVLEHAWADLTVSVEAGCSIGKLQELVARHGQRLAIDPLWPDRATIGGILSTNDSGALRLRFGSLRDLIIGVTIALADGTVASSGGKVVKNVAGYDLPKLVTGALGTLGVITRAIFRLHPLPKERRTISWSASDAAGAQRIVLAIQNSRLAHSALQVRFGEGKQPQVDVLFEGIEAGLAAQTEQVRSMLQSLAPRESQGEAWTAPQEIYRTGRSGRGFIVAKFSTLPSRIADTLSSICGLCPDGVGYAGVVQATGVGCLRLEGKAEVILDIARALRGVLEKADGSLVVRHRPTDLADWDAWGAAGDAAGLMRAVKQQFDPGRILNPGRFVGGI